MGGSLLTSRGTELGQNMLRQLEELHLSYEQVTQSTAEVIHLSGWPTLSSWSMSTHTGSTVPTASQLSLTEASSLASHCPMSPHSHQVAFASPRGQLSTREVVALVDPIASGRWAQALQSCCHIAAPIPIVKRRMLNSLL